MVREKVSILHGFRILLLFHHNRIDSASNPAFQSEVAEVLIRWFLIQRRRIDAAVVVVLFILRRALVVIVIIGLAGRVSVDHATLWEGRGCWA